MKASSRATELHAAVRAQAANAITLLRMLLVFVAVDLALSASPWLRAAAAVSALALALDWADGVVARRPRIASRLGAVLDIAGDRVAETAWWITLATTGTVPLAVPLVVVARGVIVDALRALALARGRSAFGERTMLRSRAGHALVASRASRAAYGGLKAIAFPALFLLHALKALDAEDARHRVALLAPIASLLVVATVAFCVLRALPVLAAARDLVSEEARA